MKIGCPKEIKNHEYRVGLVPAAVKAYVKAGHDVLMEREAGLGSGITDAEYLAAGAQIADTAEEVWAADMIVKVKEPLQPEYDFMKRGQIVYTYFHFAADRQLTRACMDKGIAALAYETVQEADGSLPLLTPMSEVAGRLAVQIGAVYLEAPNGGRGVLLGGVPGVAPGNVIVLGGGVVGTNAAKIAIGMGAKVTIIDKSLDRLRQLDDIFQGRAVTLASNVWTIRETLRQADLVIGGVLNPGASAPKLVRRDMLPSMKNGAVMVDVSIDQGGCFETSHPTTHTDPIYFVDGVLHYCVSNMPAAVPHTSTMALTNATLPYLLELANQGLEGACAAHPAIREGVNTYRGSVTYPAVAESQGREWKEIGALV
jgi:alanine dehydrogenase